MSTDDTREALTAMVREGEAAGMYADDHGSAGFCTVPGHEHEFAHACRACIGDDHAGVDIADPPGISADQAARNEAGAASVRAKYTRPAWLDQPATEGETP